MFRKQHLMANPNKNAKKASGASAAQPRVSEMAQLTKNFDFCDINDFAFDDDAEDQPSIILGPTTDTLEKALDNIKNNKHPDLLVVVCGKEFHVHYDILALYSNRIVEYKLSSTCVFNSPEISPVGFELVYNWMKSDDDVVFSGKLVDMIRAAIFLDVPRLEARCWKAFQAPMFNEFGAFEVLVDSRDYTNMSILYELMTPKISTSIMTIFLTPEYVLLNVEQVMGLIRSRYLAVNAEIEVFYGACVWLDHLWPSRKIHVFDVLQHIRFGLFSITLLDQLKAKQKGCVGPFEHIFEAMYQNKHIAKLVLEGMLYNTMQSLANGDTNKLKRQLQKLQMSWIEPRRWMWDDNCSYHVQVQTHFPNVKHISYEEVWTYFKSLQKYDLDYEKNMHFAADENIQESGEEQAEGDE